MLIFKLHCFKVNKEIALPCWNAFCQLTAGVGHTTSEGLYFHTRVVLVHVAIWAPLHASKHETLSYESCSRLPSVVAHIHGVGTTYSRTINWNKAWQIAIYTYAVHCCRKKLRPQFSLLHRICYSQFSQQKINSCCFCVFISSFMLAIPWLLPIPTLTSTCFECHLECWVNLR